jgi:hypothetical protein
MITGMEHLRALVARSETNWEQHSDVRAVYHDGLVLLNYTAKAQFAGHGVLSAGKR